MSPSRFWAFIVALVVTAAGCSRTRNEGQQSYPHFEDFPSNRTMSLVRVSAAPWLCEDRYREIAAPVLRFIDDAARHLQTDVGARSKKMKDARTGWSVMPMTSGRSAGVYTVQLAVYPSGSADASTQWDSITRCKPIRFGHVAEAARLGLPNTVHRLYYAADIGLYLVRP